MSATGQPDEPPGPLTLSYAGLSYDRTGMTISLLTVRPEELNAFNGELARQKRALRGPRLNSRRANTLARRRASFHLITGIPLPGVTTLRANKAHPEQGVNYALTWLTSRFTAEQRAALALMQTPQGPAWYHLTSSGPPTPLSADCSALADLPVPEPEARRPLEVARLVTTLNHRYLALPGDSPLPPDLPGPPPGSKNPNPFKP
ncbi:hypothetical protein [Streptomyces filamentosus]|uniref:hypothetical protein n=1 Tax=Streptomyces filamentosus TaxID=67294 RepID=UPI0034071129